MIDNTRAVIFRSLRTLKQLFGCEILVYQGINFKFLIYIIYLPNQSAQFNQPEGSNFKMNLS